MSEGKNKRKGEFSSNDRTDKRQKQKVREAVFFPSLGSVVYALHFTRISFPVLTRSHRNNGVSQRRARQSNDLNNTQSIPVILAYGSPVT